MRGLFWHIISQVNPSTGAGIRWYSRLIFTAIFHSFHSANNSADTAPIWDMRAGEIWGELYEKNITKAETNMGLGFDSTMFGVSVCKVCNGIRLTLP